ncbi:hypothetical protein CDAR_6551 [Caerostris darwini]|uniref:Uncharacterized protein n=1 Tax=Caerostris darwini TaxID=1538125 RepID=A0AAV4MPC9_9ARAC|nr:hypothetical protein CDAR_6551 [Caerostris darwini]
MEVNRPFTKFPGREGKTGKKIPAVVSAAHGFPGRQFPRMSGTFVNTRPFRILGVHPTRGSGIESSVLREEPCVSEWKFSRVNR